MRWGHGPRDVRPPVQMVETLVTVAAAPEASTPCPGSAQWGLEGLPQLQSTSLCTVFPCGAKRGQREGSGEHVRKTSFLEEGSVGLRRHGGQWLSASAEIQDRSLTLLLL